MTLWRVTANITGKRIASKTFPTKAEAQKYADETNAFGHHHARVVKDSERIRKMIP